MFLTINHNTFHYQDDDFGPTNLKATRDEYGQVQVSITDGNGNWTRGIVTMPADVAARFARWLRREIE